ncbi:MAG: hypothetical protein ACYTCU_02900 [Planctomycetota bacterium]|jgi:hypothetical protein
MTARAPSLQRWLHTATAALALLLGTGAHGWLHSHGATPDADCVTQGIELHAGDCEHHGEQVADHETDCLVCKTSNRQVALPLDESATVNDDVGGCLALSGPRDLVRASAIPGVLGARAPPVTTG